MGSFLEYYTTFKPTNIPLFDKDKELSLRILLCLINKINFYNIKFQKNHIYYEEIFNLIDESFVVLSRLICKDKNITMGQLSHTSFDEDSEDLLSEEEFATEFVDANGLSQLYEEANILEREQILKAARKFIILKIKNKNFFAAINLKRLGCCFFKLF